MVDGDAQKVDMPTAPAPIYSSQPAMSPMVTTQPGKTQQMTLDEDEVLRLRGGCGCLIGGLAVETGPCICHTTGYGILGCLACIVVFIPNVLAGGIIGTVNCLLCGACHNVHCGAAENVHNHS